MTVEIDSIISSAMETIDGGDNGGGDIDTGDRDDTPDVPAADAADATADAGAEDADAGGDSGQPAEPAAAGDARSADDIAFDAELAELGLSAPKPGQRDNRIPYSRIRKIVANAKTKWSEKLKGEHTTELSARDQKIKDNEERAAQFDAAEKLIETDPERYLGLLAQIYPEKYKGYAKAKSEDPQTPQEPQPDIKYDDGTVGYSPDQFAKLRAYERGEAARIAREDVTKEFNERFGPMEQEYKAAQQGHQQLQQVRGDIGKLREQWGADHIDNLDVQKAIIAHMDANPKDTLVAATRTVMLARIQANRTTMRAEILKEMKGAKTAAAKAPAAPDKSDAANASESIDDIIVNAMRSIR